MPRAKVNIRRDPLYTSIEEGSGHLRSEAKARHKRQPRDTEDRNDVVDSTTTERILELARMQQDEIEAEERAEAERTGFRAFEQEEALGDDDIDEEEEREYGEIDWDDVPEDANPEDLEIFEKFVAEEEGTLADRIMAQVNAQTGYVDPEFKNAEPEKPEGVLLPPKVIEVYTQVGALLSRYRSGKLPRAFKIVPTLRNWRDVLYVTDPEMWSDQAVYEATKLFVASMPTHQTHKFVRAVLLPRFRDQVRDTKAVGYHVYRALKRALFKPQAFFKGLLFPLLSEMEPTNREAVIVSSVLAKTSVPVLHSAAALMFVAELPYSPANAIVIKTLLDKRYALPYKVVDAVVFYFARFRGYENPLPLVWHQTLLAFCQRYKNDITDDQRDTLVAVTRIQPHEGISPEVRRELLAGSSRSA